MVQCLRAAVLGYRVQTVAMAVGHLSIYNVPKTLIKTRKTEQTSEHLCEFQEEARGQILSEDQRQGFWKFAMIICI
jgi:hypothetical protein